MSGFSIEIERRIAASPEIVYSFFTDPEKYRTWQGISATIDPTPGGMLAVDFSEHGGARGRYLVLDPPHRLVYTWGWSSDRHEQPEGMSAVPEGSSRVEIELIRDGDGTLLRVRHTGLPSAPAREFHVLGWDTYLARLATAAAGGDPGPDPATSILARLGIPQAGEPVRRAE